MSPKVKKRIKQKYVVNIPMKRWERLAYRWAADRGVAFVHKDLAVLLNRHVCRAITRYMIEGRVVLP